ncbi:hypothetical protein TNCT_138491 [Trichonephila clavata]|uniref:Uncharacterized protein n=1 Tax=Trichonephila clavata TaxID=2740835 RepID=A0A8X6HYP6_TRICU|nr:hypothetical protein TNCT_138491 [Trichonephila clavata]
MYEMSFNHQIIKQNSIFATDTTLHLKPIFLCLQGGVQCHHEGVEDVSPDHGGDGREPPESGRRAQEPLLHDAAP